MPVSERGLLLAYVHQRPATPDASRELLLEYIAAFARREGYELGRVLVGREGFDDRPTVGNLVREIGSRGACTVLIAGVSPQAIAAVGRLTDVNVITLAETARAVSRVR
jgi:hypothetical protein